MSRDTGATPTAFLVVVVQTSLEGGRAVGWKELGLQCLRLYADQDIYVGLE